MIKHIKATFSALNILVFLAVLLVGCLKSKDLENGKLGLYSQGEPLNQRSVGFALPFNSGLQVAATSVSVKATPQPVSPSVIVKSFGIDHSVPYTLTMAVDLDSLYRYNKAIFDDSGNPDDTLEVLPTVNYKLNLSVTIPANSDSIHLPLEITTTNGLSPSESYALPLKIVSVNNGAIVPTKAKNIIVKINVKNKYQGNYISNGYFYHPTGPRAINNRPKYVVTVDETTSEVELGDLGGAGYVANFKVNPDNTLTITAAAGAAQPPYTQMTSLPTTLPGYVTQWPGSSACNNTYDPDTRTFKVRYGYMGGTGWRVTEEFIKFDKE